MGFDWVEWFGYLASLVVLVSLTMTSIMKLRLINLAGCFLFATFAYLIDSVPTVFMNLGIAAINVYFLYKIYTTKEEFKLISASPDSEYFKHFIETNKQDIALQVNPDKLQEVDTCFYMLRDNNIAGVLAGNKDEKGNFVILLDYVTQQYRDFKLGNYYYQEHPNYIKEKGIEHLTAFASNEVHANYLQKIGFTKETGGTSNTYTKKL